MKTRVADHLTTVFFIISLLTAAGSSEHDLFLEFCGKWRHGNNSLSLNIDVSPGCGLLNVLANESSLSVRGRITANCHKTEVIHLNKYVERNPDTDFCLHWEPLLDQMMLKVGERNLVLCPPSRPEQNCCTDLSNEPNMPEAKYGIDKGRVRTDNYADKTLEGYSFKGAITNCKNLCDLVNQTSVKGFHNTEHPCAQKYEKEMKNDSKRERVSTSGPKQKTSVTVDLPPALTSKVSVTFFKNISMFPPFSLSAHETAGPEEAKPLMDVVEISVENEIIADLPEPVKIFFDHDYIPGNLRRKCVAWDTHRDPLEVNWLDFGCKTKRKGSWHTECQCDHLTYFTVLVQLEPKPVRHLLALTAITYVGCAASFISCIGVIVFFCRNRRRTKEQSVAIHLGLTLALALLSLIFFFTGVLANVGGDNVCTWVGALLHYALLSSLTWMGIEVLNTFWLVYMVFRPSPRPYVWYLIGFVLPVVPVGILAGVGDIYGMAEIEQADDEDDPYRMCWMKLNEQNVLLAHCFTTMALLAVLVSSGVLMLFLVFREIRTRDEWKQNRVAFLSIWGLSCLFGVTWGLTFLNIEPLSDFILFLSCFLNSFQGFFLMLRFYMMNWVRKQANRSVLGSTSSGSVKQHMLQTTEKS
ncbi:adhesion G-protein coupled receptor G1 [Poeciliopsis prolifica]|uniref:adhesion G-protein coupled receptor G1 n=1 Tax=Poeciliopsis prolifica TaxID=188132 RepID=UPI0024143100|nr:adhesion G-protein coupled receptor G1 [Poeciliopsis prolifica]XP_054916056.1 adhesion G-protein coupled receptor G1 [Poeciliopsis prolifica]XP_054916057.1 adhesion G-protein coupled receptor G1 [Poeciliopsis prolifica]